AGTITLGTITTSATTGNAGSVLLIGQGGVLTKAITATGGSGGAVGIYGAAAVLSAGLKISNGQLIGTITPGSISTANGAGIVVDGAINTTGRSLASGQGGNVTIQTDSQISVSCGIITKGAVQGGNVSLRSLNSAVTIGSFGINTSGLALTSGTSTAN